MQLGDHPSNETSWRTRYWLASRWHRKRKVKPINHRVKIFTPSEAPVEV